MLLYNSITRVKFYSLSVTVRISNEMNSSSIVHSTPHPNQNVILGSSMDKMLFEYLSLFYTITLLSHRYTKEKSDIVVLI